jgi:hypothetical protein
MAHRLDGIHRSQAGAPAKLAHSFLNSIIVATVTPMLGAGTGFNEATAAALVPNETYYAEAGRVMSVQRLLTRWK